MSQNNWRDLITFEQQLQADDRPQEEIDSLVMAVAAKRGFLPKTKEEIMPCLTSYKVGASASDSAVVDRIGFLLLHESEDRCGLLVEVTRLISAVDCEELECILTMLLSSAMEMEGMDAPTKEESATAIQNTLDILKSLSVHEP